MPRVSSEQAVLNDYGCDQAIAGWLCNGVELFMWQIGWGTNTQIGIFELLGPECLLPSQDERWELKEL